MLFGFQSVSLIDFTSTFSLCVDSNRVKTIIIFCDELFSEAADKRYFLLYRAMCIVYCVLYLVQMEDVDVGIL